MFVSIRRVAHIRGGPTTPHQRSRLTPMIEALKDDAVLSKFGGRFKLCVLVQHRLRELMDGARPLVDRHGRSDLEIVFEEILQDKITIEHEPTDDVPAL